MPQPPRPQIPAGLYAITDAGFGDPVRLGIALLDAGCGALQLRAKGWAAAEVGRAAAALLPHARRAGALLIINDHVEVAIAVGADGVHLGLDDGDLAQARARLPAHMVLGASTRELPHIDAAAPYADYLGFGPVFATSTRPGLPEPRGVARLAEAVRHSPRPIVAIGGITADNLAGVIGAGAHAWAVISAILGAPDISEATRGFRTQRPS